MLNSILAQRTVANMSEMGIRGTLFTGLTVGTVVSTNDPQQMGRLYVHCPELGDSPSMLESEFESLPLCTYLSPFAGSASSTLLRGTQEEQTTGPVPYGFWSIPKRGAQVAVMCIDGDVHQRVWVGCLYDQFVTNALPHGRFMYDQNGQQPEGPLSTTEQPVQPLYANQTEAFGTRTSNFEWRTRGADYQAASVTGGYVERSPSKVSDDFNKTVKQEDDTEIVVTQGYGRNGDVTGGGAESPDSQVFSWTTPGFHSLSMDDRPENCRIRLRTTSGHQIIFDDTNERIYINTARGNNWIEIDEDGCIDIFSTEKISATARHINFTAEETIRMYGKTGVHIRSDADVRIQAGENIDVRAGGDYRLDAANVHTTSRGTILETSAGSNETKAGGNILETSDGTNEVKSTGSIRRGSSATIDDHAAGNIHQTTAGSVNVSAAGDILNTAGRNNETHAGGRIIERGTQIHMNGPSAKAAAKATKPVDAKPATLPIDAHFVNRYPLHEPWPRTGTKDDTSVEPKYEYNDPLVGREHKSRGTHWRR